jgi:hypothetical protein
MDAAAGCSLTSHGHAEITVEDLAPNERTSGVCHPKSAL